MEVFAEAGRDAKRHPGICKALSLVRRSGRLRALPYPPARLPILYRTGLNEPVQLSVRKRAARDNKPARRLNLNTPKICLDNGGKYNMQKNPKMHPKFPLMVLVIVTLQGCSKVPQIGPNAILRQAVLVRANLSNAHLHNADLRGADLTHANLIKADLSGANLCALKLNNGPMGWHGTILDNADLTGANLRSANLVGASFRNAKLDGADLRGAIISIIHIGGETISGPVFIGASLRGVNLQNTIISAAFSKADLTGANLQSATIAGVFRGTVFRQANLKGADLRMALLYADTDFSRAMVDRSTKWPVSARHIKGTRFLPSLPAR